MDKEQIIARLRTMRIQNMRDAKMYARLARTDKNDIRSEAYRESAIGCREDALVLLRAANCYKKYGQ